MTTDLLSIICDYFWNDFRKAEFSISLCFILSLLFSWYVLPRILIIARRKNLYDDPDTRKSHVEKIPRLGGLAFVPSILISLSLTIAVRYLINFPLNPLLSGSTLLEFLFLTAGCVFLYFVGIKDDLVGVRYRKKFISQFLVASLLPMSGLYINNMYGLLGVYELPALIGVPFTIILIVFITNAVNLMDGIDGLAGGGSLICFLVYGILYFSQGLWIYSMLAFALVGCLLPFLFYNIKGSATHGSKIFMGDTGSLTMGYLLSFFAIKYAQYVAGTELEMLHFIIPFSLLFTPVFDALRVMCVRAFQNQPLFLADRNHIHHKCLAAGLTHLQSTGLLLGYLLVIVFFNGWMCHYCNLNILIIINMLLGIFLNHVLTLFTNRKRNEESVSIRNHTGL
nr:MraY family glycosyltransferase [Parabacteroides goldsteinii]